MSNFPLGQIITTEQFKDAIHVAVAPVEAGEWLAPGHHVRIAASGKAVGGLPEDCIGIVDPFLKEHVLIGQKFWLFLYPGTIKSLRHDWEHPSFTAAVPVPCVAREVSASEKWLRDFAETVGRSYGELLEMADDLASDHRAFAGDESAQDRFNARKEEFLEHLTAVTGKTFGDVYFSCSC